MRLAAAIMDWLWPTRQDCRVESLGLQFPSVKRLLTCDNAGHPVVGIDDTLLGIVDAIAQSGAHQCIHSEDVDSSTACLTQTGH